MRGLTPLLKQIGADSVEMGEPEADVGPLRAAGVPTLAINTDQSRYFWYHHTDADTMEKLNPVDISKCVAVFAVLANAVGNMVERVPR
jgi:carboxypeptidase Q